MSHSMNGGVTLVKTTCNDTVTASQPSHLMSLSVPSHVFVCGAVLDPDQKSHSLQWVVALDHNQILRRIATIWSLVRCLWTWTNPRVCADAVVDCTKDMDQIQSQRSTCTVSELWLNVHHASTVHSAANLSIHADNRCYERTPVRHHLGWHNLWNCNIIVMLQSRRQSIGEWPLSMK